LEIDLTFLNPIALFGLFAALIPILLHIFNLRKLKRIEFSTLTFLKELQKNKIRRIKIRQLILLILRTLLIFFIVLAFSRPTLKGTLPSQLAIQVKSTAIILIDDSPSMSARDEQGIFLRQAKSIANDILNFIKEGDEVFIIKLSETINENFQCLPCRNFTYAKNAIDNIQISSIRGTIDDGLNYCAKLLSTTQNYNKEIYIISDLTLSAFKTDLPEKNKNKKLVFPPATQLYLVQAGNAKIYNIGIESVEITSTILEVNKPFTINVKIANYGYSRTNNNLLKVYLGDECVAQKAIDVQNKQTKEIEFSLIPSYKGFIEGRVELEDDNLIYDNLKYFIVHIPDQVNVLLVGDEKDYKYIKLALRVSLADSGTTFNIKETSANRFSSLHLEKANVVIITDLGNLSTDQCMALKSYTQDGGGILVIPNAKSTLTEFNNKIKNILGYSLNASMEQFTAEQKSYTEFEKIDYKHPLFAGMLQENEQEKQREKTLESPQISTYLRFSITPNSRVVISLANGPFLMEEKVSRNGILFLSIPATLEWSDFPMRSIFAPIIYRSVTYLGQRYLIENAIIAGEPKIIKLNEKVSSKLLLKRPDGSIGVIAQEQYSQGKKLNLNETNLPGFYTVIDNNSILRKFAVNIDPAESNITSAEESFIMEHLEKQGLKKNSIHILKNPSELQRKITETRLGVELWKNFVLLALFIAILEMIIARENKKSTIESGLNIT